MHRLVSSVFAIFFLLTLLSSLISARPTDKLVRVKRQSDQRLAELETLLALQKYRHNRLRPGHKGSQPGYGVIDFNTIGRRKKSTRFSPGEPRFVGRQEDSFSQAANNLVGKEPFALPEGFPTVNENVKSLQSYKSYVVRDEGRSPARFQDLEAVEDKK